MKLGGFDEPRVFPPDLCLFACLNCVLDEVKQIPPLIGSCTIVQHANLARRIKEETARRRLSVRFYYINPVRLQAKAAASASYRAKPRRITALSTAAEYQPPLSGDVLCAQSLTGQPAISFPPGGE